MSSLLLENFEFQVRGDGGSPRGRHTARCQLLAPASPGSWQAPGSKLHRQSQVKLGQEALLWKDRGLAGEAGEADEVGRIQEEQVSEADGIPGPGKGTPAPSNAAGTWHHNPTTSLMKSSTPRSSSAPCRFPE